MRLLFAALMLIALSCGVTLGQQTDKPKSTLSTPMSDGLVTSDQLRDAGSLRSSGSHQPFAQLQIGSFISPSGQTKTENGPFVFQDGALYMRVAGGQFLVPVSGGGASGCFSLDLPQRIKNLKEFIPKLDSLGRSRAAPHKAEAIF